MGLSQLPRVPDWTSLANQRHLLKPEDECQRVEGVKP